MSPLAAAGLLALPLFTAAFALRARGGRKVPSRGARVVVQIDGFAPASFSSLETLSVDQEVTELREGGDSSVRKLPGRIHYPNIVLKRPLRPDHLWAWREQMNKGVFEARDGSILIFGPNRQLIAKYNFYSAWPAKWQGAVLDAKGNEVAIETIELVTEGLELAK